MSIRENMIKLLDKINSNKKNRLNDMMEPKFIDCDEEKRIFTIEFRTKDWEKNVRDEVHGGAVASMFDLAMGGSVVACFNNKQVSTVELSISYIRPFVDEEYHFVTEVIHPGRKLVRVESKAYSKATGKLVATCKGDFIALDKDY